MKQYRKKPVVIEARQWEPPSTKEKLAEWLRWLPASAAPIGSGLSIKTLEGVMRANEGDWIIKGVAGEFYPCKPDIFEATYEEV